MSDVTRSARKGVSEKKLVRRFLPLLLTAGILSPTAAMAESTWLILRYAYITTSGGSAALEKVKMPSLNQCELMGAKWMGTSRIKRETDNFYGKKLVFGYECLTGE